MEVVALVSGGKDSCMAMLECVRLGHRIVALANLLPPPSAPDELDSFMFQTVGHTVLQSYAQCMGLPLFRNIIRGKALNQDLHYAKTREDEVESLYELLKEVKRRFPGLQGVASGAILSDYQRFRVEDVCERLGLVSLAYLWQRDQKELLQEMTQVPIDAVLVKVAAMGLDPYKHLGKSISALRPLLLRLSDEYGCHPCGEGGEYETLTLDCPLFHYKIVLDETEVIIHSDDQFAQVGYLTIRKHHLEPKSGSADPPKGEVYDVWEDRGEEVTPTTEPKGQELPHARVTADLNLTLSQSAHGFFVCGSVNTNNSTHDDDDTVEAQLDRIFAGVKGKLQESSFAMEDIFFVCLYLRDMSRFVRCNGVYRRHFGANPPSRLCVQMPLQKNVHVLLECLGQRRSTQAEDERRRRRVLHVQSISRWAPACIGPYSQATALDGLVHLAGQIALDPATMKLVGADQELSAEERIKAETLQSLANVSEVLTVMQSSPAHVVVGTCFLIDMQHRDLVLRMWNDWTTCPREIAQKRKSRRPQLGFGFDSDSDDDGELEIAEDPSDEGAIHQHARPLLKFIQAGALPRAAAVEFQVVATLRSSPRDVMAISGDGVAGRWSPGCCFAHVSVKDEQNPHEALEALRRNVVAADRRLWERRLCLRLYVSAQKSSTAIQELQRSIGEASLSIVPCAGLEAEDDTALLECVTLPPPEYS